MLFEVKLIKKKENAKQNGRSERQMKQIGESSSGIELDAVGDRPAA
jgi:hypothetical protein